MGFGQTRERLILDNGIVLTVRTWGGGSIRGKEDQIKKMNMFDVEEQMIRLHPRNFGSTSQEIDAAVFRCCIKLATWTWVPYKWVGVSRKPIYLLRELSKWATKEL